VLVDDDREVLNALERVLRRAEPDWEILTAMNGVEAMALLEGTAIDVVVTDLHMPEMDGFRLLNRIARSQPGTVRIVHSSHTATLGTELIRYLAHNVLEKPAPYADIIAMLRWATGLAASLRQKAERSELG
jgi:DNA-binding NtrC family response regulator